MTKHAFSHGLAVLICKLPSGILVKRGRDYYPPVIEKLGEVSWDIYAGRILKVKFSLIRFPYAASWQATDI